jgi:two-component system sensor histidine kinase BaeS
MRRTSLRLRLSIAFVAVAALAVGLATLLSTQGLEPRLTDAAEARISRSVDRLSAAVAARYRSQGRWSEGAARDLEHLALTTGMRLVIVRPNGRPIRTPDSGRMLADALRGQGATSRPIFVNGARAGAIHAAPMGGSLLSPADVNLRDSLDRLHMIAGAIAIAIALVAALLLAQTMTAPMRRIRATAQRMERGDLDAAVEPGGDAEVRAVGHALNRLAETLQHEDRLRRENVADLAHELRTPVSGMLSRIEAAQDGVLSDEGANLEAMHVEALRLQRLLDDLDRLAAAERPGLLLDMGVLDFAVVAKSEADQMEASFAEKGIALERDLAPTTVEGDRDRLAQIIANLLSNALRYTEPGGRVEIRVAPQGQSAVLEVGDTGIGIEAQDLEHIFKRFWRADKSRSRATGGTGIGLAIVRELVIAHNGRIDVESAPGQGSRFRVTFPKCSAEAIHENGRTTSHGLQTHPRS